MASNVCVYVKGSGDNYVMLTLYVDDVFMPGPKKEIVAKLREDTLDQIHHDGLRDSTQILGIDII